MHKPLGKGIHAGCQHTLIALCQEDVRITRVVEYVCAVGSQRGNGTDTRRGFTPVCGKSVIAAWNMAPSSAWPPGVLPSLLARAS